MSADEVSRINIGVSVGSDPSRSSHPYVMESFQIDDTLNPPARDTDSIHAILVTPNEVNESAV